MSTLLEGLKVEDITTGLEDTKYGLVNDYGIVTSKIELETAAHAVKCHDQIVERLRLANMLIDKIDDKKYRQMIGTYKLLAKTKGGHDV